MRTRYEIEVTRLKDGRLYLRAFDEYWDGVKTASLDTATKSPTLKGDTALIAALKPVESQLAQLKLLVCPADAQGSLPLRESDQVGAHPWQAHGLQEALKSRRYTSWKHRSPSP